jgi:hypothetical protein
LGGFLARTIYEHELEIVSNDPSQQQRALQALQYFNFRPSEPARCFSEKMKESFFKCTPSCLPILSTLGVRRASEIRDHDPNAVLFLKSIPMLPAVIAEAAKAILQDLPTGKTKPMDLADVMRELSAEGRVLDNDELVACIRWILDLFGKLGLPADKWQDQVLMDFKDNCRYYRGDQPSPLKPIRHYIAKDSPDDSLPPTARTIPPEIMKGLPNRDWKTVLGWFPLTVIDLLDERLEQRKDGRLREKAFLECVLDILPRWWGPLDNSDRDTVRRRLADVPWLPTHKGYQKASEIHLPDPDILSIKEVPILELGRPLNGALRDIVC